MKGWVGVDAQGRSFVLRAGTGVITAVVPIGIPDADGDGDAHAWHRIEIDVAPRARQPRAVQVRVHARVPTDSLLLGTALECAESGEPVAWEVEWHRHPWIPAELDATLLDLAHDATAYLSALAPASSVDALDLAVDRGERA